MASVNVFVRDSEDDAVVHVRRLGVDSGPSIVLTVATLNDDVAIFLGRDPDRLAAFAVDLSHAAEGLAEYAHALRVESARASSDA